MSVHLGDELDRAQVPPEEVLATYPGAYLVAFAARAAREVHQAVCRDPMIGEIAHGLVVGKKSSARKNALAKASVWVVSPEGACNPPVE